MDIPQGARAKHNLALREGWGVETTAGEGAVMLRFHRPGAMLAAVWSDEPEFLGCWAKPWGLRGLTVNYNSTQLAEILAIPADEFQWPEDPLKADLPDDEREIMAQEKEYLGTYVTKHPLEFVNMHQYPDVMAISDLLEQGDELAGERIQLLGLVEEAKVARSARGTWWARYSIADLTGLVNGLAFGDDARRIKAGAVLHLKGKVDIRDESPVFVALRVQEVKW